MASLEKTLLAGEEVLKRGALSPLRLYGDLAVVGVGVALLIAGFVLIGSAVGAGVGIPVAGVGGVVLLVGLWRLVKTMIVRKGTEMVVTNKRVLLRTGVFSKDSDEMFLNKVESVEVDQQLWERLANVGTVMVHGSGDGRLGFVGIAAPHEFRKACLAAVEAERAGGSSRAGAPAAAPGTVYEVQIVDAPGGTPRWIEVRAASVEQAKALAAGAGVKAGEARLKRIG
ncbi:MAG: PH domain-containing protein [Phycisphaerales bacterium]